MADVVATFGADSSEYQAEIKRMAAESGLLKDQIQRAIAPAQKQMETLAGTVHKMGGEVRGAVQSFRHMMFAPLMIAGIASEFHRLGEAVVSVAHDIEYSMQTGLEHAKDFMDTIDPSNPTAALDLIDKKLKDINKSLGEAAYMESTREERLGSKMGKELFSGPDVKKLEAEKAELLRQRGPLSEAVQAGENAKQKRIYEQQLRQQEWEQESLRIMTLRSAGLEKEAAIAEARLRTTREIYKVERDTTISADQRRSLTAMIFDRGAREAAFAGSEVDRRFGSQWSAHSSIMPGLYNSQTGVGPFGLAGGSASLGSASSASAQIAKRQDKQIELMTDELSVLKRIQQDNRDAVRGAFFR